MLESGQVLKITKEMVGHRASKIYTGIPVAAGTLIQVAEPIADDLMNRFWANVLKPLKNGKYGRTKVEVAVAPRKTDPRLLPPPERDSSMTPREWFWEPISSPIVLQP